MLASVSAVERVAAALATERFAAVDLCRQTELTFEPAVAAIVLVVVNRQVRGDLVYFAVPVAALSVAVDKMNTLRPHSDPLVLELNAHLTEEVLVAVD